MSKVRRATFPERTVEHAIEVAREVTKQPAIDLELLLGVVGSNRDGDDCVVYMAETVSKSSRLRLRWTHAGGFVGA